MALIRIINLLNSPLSVPAPIGVNLIAGQEETVRVENVNDVLNSSDINKLLLQNYLELEVLSDDPEKHDSLEPTPPVGGPAAACQVIGGSLILKTPLIDSVDHFATGRYKIFHSTGIPSGRQFYVVTPFGATSTTVGADWGVGGNPVFVELTRAGASVDDNFRFMMWDIDVSPP